jgi:hypothetical protein
MRALAELGQAARAAIEDVDRLRQLLATVGADPAASQVFDAVLVAVREIAATGLEIITTYATERQKLEARIAESDRIASEAMVAVRAARALIDAPTTGPAN